LASACSPGSQIALEDVELLVRTDLEAPATFSVQVGETTADRTSLSAAELSAACQTLDDAITDFITSDDLQIVADDGLLRSAELLAGAFEDDVTALEVESFIVNGVVERQEIDERLNAQGKSDTERARGLAYLEARAMPPSEGSEERYVVYAVKKLLRRVQIVRRSIFPLPTVDTTERRVVELLRADGSSIGVEAAACASPN